MQKPLSQRLDAPQDMVSREGVRSSLARLYGFLREFLRKDSDFKEDVYNTLTPLYGEFAYTPGLINNGAQAVVSITVASANLGYTCDVSYDQDLLQLQMTAYVVSGAVKVILKNDTGGGVTLTAGKFRAYVWPRTLTS